MAEICHHKFASETFRIYNKRCYFMYLQISFLLDTLNFFHLLIHSLMYLQGGS